MYEKKFLTHDLEIGAEVFELKVYWHYHYGTKFEVFTYHKTLKYIFNQHDLKLIQRSWLEFIKDYDFSKAYFQGKSNVVADGLSRNARAKISSLMTMQWRLMEDIIEVNSMCKLNSLLHNLTIPSD